MVDVGDNCYIAKRFILLGSTHCFPQKRQAGKKVLKRPGKVRAAAQLPPLPGATLGQRLQAVSLFQGSRNHNIYKIIGRRSLCFKIPGGKIRPSAFFSPPNIVALPLQKLLLSTFR
jgi:hypothetical protein